MQSIVNMLRERGCSTAQAGKLAGYLSRVGPAEVQAFVPGRIELVGNHVDYAGGSSLTIATERGIVVAADPVDERELRIEVELVPSDSTKGSQHLRAVLPLVQEASGTGWTSYPATLIRRILDNVPSSRRGNGAAIRLVSDLPLAAGLSSSSAFLVALFLGWGHASGWLDDAVLREALSDKQSLADYLATVENGRDYRGLAGRLGVGTIGGSQDHTAIIRSRAGQIGRYRYVNPRLEGRWAWPQGARPVVLTSGVEAEKTGAAQDAYNGAVILANRIADRLRTHDESVEVMGQLSHEELLHFGKDLESSEARRLAAFLREREAVDEAAAALESEDMVRFAAAIRTSQQAKESLLGNQIPETTLLCQLAVRAGAFCATSFGAGFGGAVWAMVPADWRPPAELMAGYRAETGREGGVLLESAGPGAFMLDGRSLLGERSEG
ncbi:MAG: galactokinase [Rhodothermales bacterium]|nr:galactokinase [Rhodothermales bacterium]